MNREMGTMAHEADVARDFGVWLREVEGRQAVRELAARNLPVTVLADTLYDMYRARGLAA